MHLYFLICSCYVTTIVYNRAGETRNDISIRTCKHMNACKSNFIYYTHYVLLTLTFIMILIRILYDYVVNAKANFGKRWVCEGFNDLAVGPSMYPFYTSILRLRIFYHVTIGHFLECACHVKKHTGYAFMDEIHEIPIRKNKSFVCIPGIAAEGIERWTYKNMNASSYSWSCKCNRRHYKFYT